MNTPVNMGYCKEHEKLIDERFRRDKDDIMHHEERIKKIEDLTLEISLLVKQNDETAKNHEKRLAALEKKPSVWLDRILNYIMSAFIAALVAAILSGNVNF